MLRRMGSYRRHKLSESQPKIPEYNEITQSPSVERISPDPEKQVVEKLGNKVEPNVVLKDTPKTDTIAPCDHEHEHRKQEDELFEMYKEFMVDTFVEHGAKQGCQKPSKDKIGGPDIHVTRPRCTKMPIKGTAYIKPISQKRDSSDIRKKATGVTRRHMEENTIARENMFIFKRLQQVSPSVTIDRRHLKRAFIKSRHHLEKMSRYESYDSQPRPCAPVWVH